MQTAEELIAALEESNLEPTFQQLLQTLETEAQSLTTADALEAFRLRWTGRKAGLMKQLGERLKAAGLMRAAGIRYNQLNEAVKEAKVSHAQVAAPVLPPLDITLPGTVRAPGIAHPLLETMNRVVEVFHQLGYSTQLGPQVESDFYNFEALNFPPNHPARVSGFAFGMGVERIAMILHGVADIGLFYSGDMRFLEQFA